MHFNSHNAPHAIVLKQFLAASLSLSLTSNVHTKRMLQERLTQWITASTVKLARLADS